jgi:hypothetical protein
VFADTRASWIGGDIHRIFSGSANTQCRGRVDEIASIGGTTFRLLGYLGGPGATLTQKADIIFANSGGQIVGLGRTLATSDGRGGVKFVGYEGGVAPDSVTAFAVMPEHQICILSR